MKFSRGGSRNFHPGEVLDQNLGRYVPPRFSKVGSLELILFFFCPKLGFPERTFTKICVTGAEFSQNLQKLILKIMIFFLQKIEVGSLELEKGLKRGVSRAKK